GEVWRAPGHARTLELIGVSGAEAFYRGELAAAIAAFARATGGFLDEADLAAFTPEWVQPLHVSYRGHEVWELPPNGQGVVALQALNILSGFTLADAARDAVVHKQIEAIKLAFADARQHLTDPRWMRIRPEQWLTPDYAAQRRALMGEHALDPAPGRLDAGGTVYLATADEEGNLVSYIQSNYLGFGSGVVVPGTGIALHNRGAAFSLAADDSNALEPGKRPYHTIIPGFLTKGGQAVGPFGVMGAYMQPQGHLQVVMNLLDFHLNPQAALDAPRWQWIEGRQVAVEREFPAHVAQALERRGHVIVKRGAAGAVAFDPAGGVTQGSPFRVEPVDTTGAGDSFNAGWIAARLSGRNEAEALTFANACGALSTLGIGGAGNLTLDKLRRFWPGGFRAEPLQ
ncbi:MAG: gamma-glutamyltransferase, partial [Alicyclobacillus sp.]|nr:gamma-glutamyltransferase [Alicyclobacillus sp.]